MILAIFFHPTLNSFMPADVSINFTQPKFPTQIAWTFALFLESVACLPQLFYFQKVKRVEAFTSHFLAGQALSKVLSFIFWVATHKELNDPTRKVKFIIIQYKLHSAQIIRWTLGYCHASHSTSRHGRLCLPLYSMVKVVDYISKRPQSQQRCSSTIFS